MIDLAMFHACRLPRRGTALPVFLTVPEGFYPPAAGELELVFTRTCAEDIPVRAAGFAGWQIYLNDELLWRGPEWNDWDAQTAQKLVLHARAGENRLLVRLWHHGKFSGGREVTPMAAFALLADAADIATASGAWKMRALPGWQVIYPHMSCMAAPRMTADLTVPPGEWQNALNVGDAQSGGWMVYESTLPAMKREMRHAGKLRAADMLMRGAFTEGGAPDLVAAGTALAAGQSTTVPAHTRRRFLFDFCDYCCAYPVIAFHGGRKAKIELLITESLFVNNDDWVNCYEHPEKGDRSQVSGKFVAGQGDVIIADGGKHTWTAFDWDAGRYLLLTVDTADEALTIDKLELEATGYPFTFDSTWVWQSEKWTTLIQLCRRALRACMHTTYMDCPHYEEMMYGGDTRLEILSTYVSGSDRRLPKKALRLFAASALADGMTLARTPSYQKMVIPGFALAFVMMIHDYARWCDDPDFVKELLPPARKILKSIADECRLESGLLANYAGWNFYDWVNGWQNGEPPAPKNEPCALFNVHYVYTLSMVAELEEYVGDAGNAAQYRETANAMRNAIRKAFFDETRGLLADDLAHTHYSEHVQVMALLGGWEDAGLYQHLFEPDLARCTIYFSSYLLETAVKFGDGKRFAELLDFWFDLPKRGFLTTPERPEPSRSDCHGWGAHVLYHLVSAAAGLSPQGFGAKAFTFKPLEIPDLPDFSMKLALPSGAIEVSRQAGKWQCQTQGNVTVKQLH